MQDHVHALHGSHIVGHELLEGEHVCFAVGVEPDVDVAICQCDHLMLVRPGASWLAARPLDELLPPQRSANVGRISRAKTARGSPV